MPSTTIRNGSNRVSEILRHAVDFLRVEQGDAPEDVRDRTVLLSNLHHLRDEVRHFGRYDGDTVHVMKNDRETRSFFDTEQTFSFVRPGTAT